MGLLEFYRGTGTDGSGRTLEEVLRRDADWLESTHDYIQWLFPLDAPSGANPSAPVLTPADIAAFQEDSVLRERLKTAFRVMLAFYGFTLSEAEGSPRVLRAKDFAARRRVWLRPYNHNFLRLTRIMKCLRLLGLPDDADALYACLKDLYAEEKAAIGPETFAFWRDAATR